MNKLSALGIAILAGLMFTPLGIPILIVFVVYYLLSNSDDDEEKSEPEDKQDKKQGRKPLILFSPP